MPAFLYIECEKNITKYFNGIIKFRLGAKNHLAARTSISGGKQMVLKLCHFLARYDETEFDNFHDLAVKFVKNKLANVG